MEQNPRHLPLELIESILTHIPSRRDLFQCILINKGFYTAAIPKIWHTPWSTCRHTVNYKTLDRVLTSLDYSCQHPQPHINAVPVGHHIRRLLFPREHSIENILKFLEQAPLVEEIQLIQQTLTDEDMAQLAQFCPQLKKLSLRSIRITDTAMIALSHSCPLLCDLELHECNLLTPTTLVALKDCPLERILLIKCDSMNTDAIIQPLINFHRLKELRLSKFSLAVGDGLVRQATTTKGWSRLETFSLMKCGYQDSPWDNDAMSLFFQSHPILEFVGLSGAYIGDASLLAIATFLPRLERLLLIRNTHISAHAVKQVAKSCLRLDHIIFLSCHFSKSDFYEACGVDEYVPSYGLGRRTLQRIRSGWTHEHGCRNNAAI